MALSTTEQHYKRSADRRPRRLCRTGSITGTAAANSLVVNNLKTANGGNVAKGVATPLNGALQPLLPTAQVGPGQTVSTGLLASANVSAVSGGVPATSHRVIRARPDVRAGNGRVAQQRAGRHGRLQRYAPEHPDQPDRRGQRDGDGRRRAGRHAVTDYRGPDQAW